MDRYVPLPPLPARISRLNELAYDLWWSWNPGAREVFRDLDYPLWRFTNHNPVLLLHLVQPERLDFAAADPEFLAVYDGAIAALDAVRSGTGTWWDRHGSGNGSIAWIAPQFALHQSLPVCATSEGVVAGDLAKEASDLGVPFVGVGLMYGRTYAHQRLASDGSQRDAVEYVDWSDAPINPVRLPGGDASRVTVPLAGSEISMAVWQVRAGRATVYLLDTDIPENAAWDRDLSSRGSDDDADARLRQSILLGAGSVVLLDQLGIVPTVWHLAGGQAAPVILERLHRLVEGGAAFSDACAQVRASTVFNARVDAPSAKDTYALGALERHLGATWPALTPHRAAILALGHHETDRSGTFNTAVLGARKCGAVTVADEGVHLSSWISAELSRVLDAHVGEEWRAKQDDESVWRTLLDVPDDEVWSVRHRLRGYLIDFMRERARRRWAREQASGGRLVALGTLLDHAALTIGCVPRFGQGGSADLLFKDVDRLARLVTAARRPVQIVFAGRVDASDESGKHHLQRTFRQTLDPKFGGRVAFLEDYDIHVARLMVQGCDLWLTMPSDAGGPSLSAVKAAVNGVPHLGFSPDTARRWSVDSAAGTYALLEDEIVPAFYERNRADVPERWTAIIRETLADAIPRYAARRALITASGSSSLTRV
ncbi:MAG TPA: alpha-glucan family phosphorylase [Vicinamibacterales bacterium]|nr:alpha-glucan family phosphorylase [Vicinamibacterales bacterium]